MSFISFFLIIIFSFIFFLHIIISMYLFIYGKMDAPVQKPILTLTVK